MLAGTVCFMISHPAWCEECAPWEQDIDGVRSRQHSARVGPWFIQAMEAEGRDPDGPIISFDWEFDYFPAEELREVREALVAVACKLKP